MPNLLVLVVVDLVVVVPVDVLVAVPVRVPLAPDHSLYDYYKRRTWDKQLVNRPALLECRNVQGVHIVLYFSQDFSDCYLLYKKNGPQMTVTVRSLVQMSCFSTCRGWVAVNWKKKHNFNEHPKIEI